MFCQKCKSEYIPGIKVCPECQIDLVDELVDDTEEYEYLELQTVFGPADASAIAIAKSLLEDEGIPFYVKNEHLQELFGIGRFSTGYNPIFGPELIQVAPEHKERASELLKDIIIMDENEIEDKE